MKFSDRVKKYYLSRQIYEGLQEDDLAIYLLFGLCNDRAATATIEQGRKILEDLKKGKLHEFRDYNPNEVTKYENYNRTGKMKYDMAVLAKDAETVGALLYRMFKSVWNLTTNDLNEIIDKKILTLIALIQDIDNATQEADPAIFETNFFKLMYRHDWTETDRAYQREKNCHCVTMEWLQEKQEQALQQVLEMDIMQYADDPSTQFLESVDYEYHRGFLSCEFKDSPNYKKAYAKFMHYATRKEKLLLPDYKNYGKYIALNLYKFRPEQKTVLFEHIHILNLIHQDMDAFLQQQSGRDCDSVATAPVLPEALATPEAMRLWQKAQKAGYVDENYQPICSRSEAALLADVMAERLGITEKWKIFEAFWNRNNMRSDFSRACTQPRTLEFREKIKRLFCSI